MSTFPPRLKFPQMPGGNITAKVNRSYENLQIVDFKCEGHTFSTIVNEHGDFVKNLIYYY